MQATMVLELPFPGAWQAWRKLSCVLEQESLQAICERDTASPLTKEQVNDVCSYCFEVRVRWSGQAREVVDPALRGGASDSYDAMLVSS